MKNSLVLSTALWVIVSSASLPLAARERRGATVVVTLADGSQVRGELLAVKGHELIIHDKSGERGYTVNIEQASEIKIKKRSRVLSGLAVGIAAGVVVGFLVYAKEHEHYVGVLPILVTTLYTAPIGAMIGVSQSSPETMAIKGGNPVQIESYLLHLQKYARE
jgi:hypothetical protein